MSDSFLELKNLRKSFTPGEYVLQGINLKIEQGEFVTLLGSSGCGKTTTLRIIAGLEQPDSGSVWLEGKDVITDPKTPKSVRVVQMPDFLTEEIRDYLKSLYKVKPTDRIFEVTKYYLHHEMDRGAKEAEVKRIRIHDLRHSHVSLLIEMGFSAVAIADRVGHESIDITYKYAHLFPSKQQEMAAKLNMERGER